MASRLLNTVMALLSLTLWAVICGGCARDPKPARHLDPLSVDDVLEELATLPRPADDLFKALNAKQDYFPDWERNWRDSVSYRTDLIHKKVESVPRNSRAEIRWADGHSVDDAIAMKNFSSWDAYTGGDHQQVHSTSDWILLFDANENVIAYIQYRPLSGP